MSESLGFPRYPDKHRGKPLLTAKNFMEAIGARDRSVPSSIALGYSPTRLPSLLAERGFVEVFGFPPPWFSIWRREGTDIGFVVGFGIGAPAAAMVLEELVELGAQKDLGVEGQRDFGCRPHLRGGPVISLPKRRLPLRVPPRLGSYRSSALRVA